VHCRPPGADSPQGSGGAGNPGAAQAGPGSYTPPPARRPTPDVNSLDPDLTPAQRGERISAAVPRYDFRVVTSQAPIAQHITTFVRGDDQYDASYSLYDPTGAFVGEMGVAVALARETGGYRQVSGLEAWLFDKEDLRSPTIVLLSPESFEDAARRAEVHGRGTPQCIEPGAAYSITAQSLQMQVIVVDVQYMPAAGQGQDAFSAVTLELAAFQHDGTPLDLALPAEGAAIHVPPPAPAAEPLPEEPPSPARDPRPRERTPQATEQRIRTSYTIDYTQSIYVNQPFVIRVEVPGRHIHEDPAEPLPGFAALPRSPGELAFVHRWYPAYQDKAKRQPGIRVTLKYREDEFQVPQPQQTVLYREGEPIALEFIAKPLKPDVLLMTVEFSYLGVRWRPEQDKEVLMTRDPGSGAVRSVTTRRTPGGLVADVRLLQTETLRIEVRSFLTLNAPELTALTRVTGGILTLAYVLWSLISAQVASVVGGITVAVSTVLSALLLTASPLIITWWGGRGGGR